MGCAGRRPFAPAALLVLFLLLAGSPQGALGDGKKAAKDGAGTGDAGIDTSKVSPSADLIYQTTYKLADQLQDAADKSYEIALEKMRVADGEFLRYGRSWRAVYNAVADDLSDLVDNAGHVDSLLMLIEGHLLGWFADTPDYEVAFELCEYAASIGEPAALLRLGMMHALGLGVPRDEARALVYYHMAARESAEAHAVLGTRFADGWGVLADCPKAAYHLSAAADAAADSFRDAFSMRYEPIYLSRDDLVETMESIEDEAAMYEAEAVFGDPAADFVMGEVYLGGHYGYIRDEARAFEHFRRAADGGVPEAHGRLGHMYLSGSGTRANNASAVREFEAGAEADDTDSIDKLAHLHRVGLAGLSADHVRAHELHARSAALKSPLGLALVAEDYLLGRGVAPDAVIGLEKARAAAKGGHPLGSYWVARVAYLGIMTEPNCTAAVADYRRALAYAPWVGMDEALSAYLEGAIGAAKAQFAALSEYGVTLAVHNYAFLLEQAQSLERSADDFNDTLSEDVLRQWHRAALAGDAWGTARLADHYFALGDHVKAAGLYSVAGRELKFARALFNLGYMHHYGIGVERNLTEARTLYNGATWYSDHAWLASLLASMWLVFWDDGLAPMVDRAARMAEAIDGIILFQATVVIVITLVLIAKFNTRQAAQH